MKAMNKPYRPWMSFVLTIFVGIVIISIFGALSNVGEKSLSTADGRDAPKQPVDPDGIATGSPGACDLSVPGGPDGCDGSSCYGVIFGEGYADDGVYNPKCCGDMTEGNDFFSPDPDEKYVSDECGVDSGHRGYVELICNNGLDWACCDNDQDCVFRRKCYGDLPHEVMVKGISALDIDGNGNIDALCSGSAGAWYDCDTAADICNSCFIADGEDWGCVGGNCWVDAGTHYQNGDPLMPSFGEYNDGKGGGNECCGDDRGEHFIREYTENGFDSNTIFLANFNDGTEALTQSGYVDAYDDSGITLKEGLAGYGAESKDAGDTLIYLTPEGFDQDKGTIEFWVKPYWEPGEPNENKVFWNMYSGPSDQLSIYYKYTTHEIYVFDSKQSGSSYFLSAPFPSLGKDEPLYIAFSWEKSTNKQILYVNGEERYTHDEGDGRLFASIANSFNIGYHEASGQRAEAIIDNVRISRYARSPEEIEASYYGNYGLCCDDDNYRVNNGHCYIDPEVHLFVGTEPNPSEETDYLQVQAGDTVYFSASAYDYDMVGSYIGACDCDLVWYERSPNGEIWDYNGQSNRMFSFDTEGETIITLRVTDPDGRVTDKDVRVRVGEEPHNGGSPLILKKIATVNLQDPGQNQDVNS
ncbi:MAG: LamG domain-containing protein [Nanoarchaeota archaeon]|nr:LamG domain-containing protein [Nanoarchaeota archaeon]